MKGLLVLLLSPLLPGLLFIMRVSHPAYLPAIRPRYQLNATTRRAHACRWAGPVGVGRTSKATAGLPRPPMTRERAGAANDGARGDDPDASVMSCRLSRSNFAWPAHAAGDLFGPCTRRRACALADGKWGVVVEDRGADQAGRGGRSRQAGAIRDDVAGLGCVPARARRLEPLGTGQKYGCDVIWCLA